jgi:DHA2 family multidrug resistance protein
MQPATRERLALLQGYFQSHGIPDAATAQHEAVIAVGRTIQAQAYYLAYGDAFGLLGLGMVVAAAATLFLRKVAVPGARAH